MNKFFLQCVLTEPRALGQNTGGTVWQRLFNQTTIVDFTKVTCGLPSLLADIIISAMDQMPEGDFLVAFITSVVPGTLVA